MKTKLLTLLFVLLFITSRGQLIQGTVKSGPGDNEIEVWIKPDFANTTSYLAQLVFPIAWPVSAPHQPTGLTVTLDPTFIANFGNNYTASVAPLAHNLANTENYRTVAVLRGGAGSSDPQTWGTTEFKVLTISFAPSNAPGAKVKLADYQDGGSDGQGQFYTADGNATYYVTANSIGNFYPSSAESIIGGTASAGFVETLDLISLPVHFLSFSGYKNGGKNTLQWVTANEMNNLGFEVERSTDAVSYNSIGFIPTQATNGNSTSLLSYSFDDNTVAGKNQYYRLKQVDFDKRFKLSNIVMITGEKPLKMLIGGLFPNPSNNIINVIIHAPQEGKIELNIVDVSGRIIQKQIENAGTGANTIGVDISKLSKGTYWIQLNAGEKLISSPFIKQ